MQFGRYAKNDPEIPCPVVNGWCQLNEDGNVKPNVEIQHKNSPRTEVVVELLQLQWSLPRETPCCETDLSYVMPLVRTK